MSYLAEYEQGMLILDLPQSGTDEGNFIAENEQGVIEGAGPFQIEWDQQSGRPVPTGEALQALDWLVQRLLDDGWELEQGVDPFDIEGLFDFLVGSPVELRRALPEPTPSETPAKSVSSSTRSVVSGPSSLPPASPLQTLPAQLTTPSAFPVRTRSHSCVGRLLGTGVLIVGLILLGGILRAQLTREASPQPTPPATFTVATQLKPPTVVVMPTPEVLTIPGNGSYTFAETGKTVSGLFLSYWEANGGLSQHGYPISGLLREISEIDGKSYTVQYFERSLLEYHPESTEPYQVVPAQLGYLRYKAKYPTDAPGQVTNPVDSVYFPETGKSVGGTIARFWTEHGGVGRMGYPISGEFIEESDLDKKPYTVQYFQRVVVELHPESTPPYYVQIAQLGTLRYHQKYSRGQQNESEFATGATNDNNCVFSGNPPVSSNFIEVADDRK